MSRNVLIHVCVLGLLVAAAGPVVADPVSDPVLLLEADDGQGGTGSYTALFTDLSGPDGNGVYSLYLSSVDLTVGGISELNLQYAPTGTYQRITLNYQASAWAEDVTFTVRSGEMSFSTLPAAYAEGIATSGWSLTDNTGDGATLAGVGGRNLCTAEYNGLVPNGTEFANLFSGLSVVPGGSDSGSESYGWSAFGEDVDSTSIDSVFSLTAGDSMSGNTQFVVTPEPTSLALVALAGLALVRIRR